MWSLETHVPRPSQVVHHVCVGSAADAAVLVREPHRFDPHIHAVLKVAEESLYDPPAEFLWKELPVFDRVSGIGDFIEEGVAYITRYQRDGNVLVHCGAGMSRSPAMVVAYVFTLIAPILQTTPKATVEKAHQMVQTAHPKTHIDPRIMGDVVEWAEHR